MLLPLDLLRAGEWADLAEVSGEPGFVNRLAELGLREGSRFCVVQPGVPCLLLLNSCRLCLRGSETTQILVRPVKGPVS